MGQSFFTARKRPIAVLVRSREREWRIEIPSSDEDHE